MKVYDYASTKQNAGYSSTNVFHTKKKVPHHKIGTGPQRTLWEEEKKRAAKTPGPPMYKPNHSLTQANRFSGIAIGYDKKCNQKTFRVTPGPSDYHTQEKLGFNKLSFNYGYNSGGLKRPDKKPYKND